MDYGKSGSRYYFLSSTQIQAQHQYPPFCPMFFVSMTADFKFCQLPIYLSTKDMST
ncbi:hypothetical protein BDZ94DRAFT_1265721 [Collybia nuda]|uniref:Uncharacterized protein n=1 Tax=Collybia nuda TaxID=64659 RepID=A0A9P6CCG9_9AGAR|nr:hypothetical protein BDZ94DRAFT_1265721 [Collybia nuda]